MKASVQLNNTKTDEFVKEKSSRPKNKGTIFIIENCSRGDKNINRINVR
jgi:hypothetical protein